MKDGFRVLTLYSEHDAIQSPAIKPSKKIETDDAITAYIASTTLEEGSDNPRTGCGITFDNFPTRARAIHLPSQLPKTRCSGILSALLVTIWHTDHTESRPTYCLSGFKANSKEPLNESEKVLRLSEDCKDPKNVIEAHNLADEGAKKRSTDVINWSVPEETWHQALAYKAITELQILPKDIARKTTAKNLKTIKQAITVTNGSPPTTKDIWSSIQKEAFTRRVKDYLFLMIHGTHRTGVYWKHISGYKDRQMCKNCGIKESMEHILVDCKESGQSTI
ncbi:hypothetical protein C8J56DRAFT_1139748 [Mycena floridula]|nr:hypothetical protein C8J56DRAFT_1139748 [Mycena floridula]